MALDKEAARLRGMSAEAQERAREIPEDIWTQCPECDELLYTKEFEDNLFVCPKCRHHGYVGAWSRIAMTLDQGSFVERDGDLESGNPLDFPDYPAKLQRAQQRTGLKEACVIGDGALGGHPVVFGVTDFGFMAGSMGSVVGEKISRALERGRARRVPVVLVSGSGGGARMQEGILSLMQMAKTSAAAALTHREGVALIIVLTHPSMAGVQASWASLGDIIVAEPGALIGFTGQRVIEQNFRITLPDDFQTSEFQLEHGMVDCVVERAAMRSTLIDIMDFIAN